MRVLVAYGTRPEQIKLRPAVEALEERGVEVREWFSGQSKDLIDCPPSGVIDWSNPYRGIAHTLTAFGEHLELPLSGAPDAVIVQGDTATAFAVALAAFLADVPVAHVEAGLRTYRREPYPEEAFRGMIARMARWHFCPDAHSRQNVGRELSVSTNYSLLAKTMDGEDRVYPNGSKSFITGNTIIDTLPSTPFRALVTLHRRENWGERIKNALRQLDEFVMQNGGLDDGEPTFARVSVIRHPNWQGQDYNYNYLFGLDPVPHEQLLDLLINSDVVVTDSGGLQEEAAHFGVPCLVLRSATERVALLENGAVQLVDPDAPEGLSDALTAILDRRRSYGDGTAGQQIADILVREFSEESETEEETRIGPGKCLYK